MMELPNYVIYGRKTRKNRGIKGNFYKVFKDIFNLILDGRLALKIGHLLAIVEPHGNQTFTPLCHLGCLSSER